MRIKLLVIALVLALILVACGGGADIAENISINNTSINEPAEQSNADENNVAELPAVQEDSPVEDLPAIPPVVFAERDDWFTPTSPDDIQIASGAVQLFDFSAIWCTYCRQMAPVLEGLEILYGEQVNFVMLDLDLDGDNEYGPFIDDLAYDPRFRPGIYILGPDGEVLNFWLGPVDGPIIQQALVTALALYP